jgi:sugar O-acyltransferase (sialic acid O-acetyltransferase NeuD family)
MTQQYLTDDMEKSTKIAILGGGGLGLEIAGYIADLSDDYLLLASEITVSVVIDKSKAREDDFEKVLGYRPEFHTDLDQCGRDIELLIAIGDPTIRDKVYHTCKESGFSFFTLVHQTAYVAGSASLGEGTIVAPHAFVGPLANVAANTVLNVSVSVGHDAVVEQSAVISPLATINGGAVCGRCSLIGTGAILFPNSGVGSYSKVAAAAVVKHKFDDGFLLHGNPADGRKMFDVPVPSE